MKAAKILVLLVIFVFAAFGYFDWQQKSEFSCSSEGTSNLIHRVISNSVERAFKDPSDKSRVDRISFKLADVITVSDGRQKKQCEGVIAMTIPDNIPSGESFSGLREIVHARIDGRILSVPITYKAQLTDNQEKELVSIDNVIPVITALGELAKPELAKPVETPSYNKIDQPQKIAEKPALPPAQETALANTWIQLTPAQAETECSIQKDILQIAAAVRLQNENRVSDQQVKKFIESNLEAIKDTYQVGEWNRLTIVPGGPTSIGATIATASSFGSAASLNRLQEIATGTGQYETASYNRCMAGYAHSVPAALPAVNWK